MRVMKELRTLHPRNRLVLLEAGSTAVRAGRFDEAVTLLSEGMRMVPADEAQANSGRRGALALQARRRLRGLQRQNEAAADLTAAASPSAQTWVHGRARVELARLALSRGDRGTASQRGAAGPEPLSAGQRSGVRGAGEEAFEGRRWPVRSRRGSGSSSASSSSGFLASSRWRPASIYYVSRHVDTREVSPGRWRRASSTKCAPASRRRSRSSSWTSEAISCRTNPDRPAQQSAEGA